MKSLPLVLALCSLLATAAVAAEPGALGKRLTAPPVPGATRVVTAAAPAGAVDLSAAFPPAMNQGRLGSCVACAVGYGIKSYQQKLDSPRMDPTAKSGQFSPSFLYNQFSNGLDNGSDPAEIFDIVGRRGCATLAQMPYLTTTATWPSAAVTAQALPYRARRVDGGDPSLPYFADMAKSDLAGMKAQLAQGVPLAMGIEVDNAWDQLSAGTSFVWYPDRAAIRGGHEIAVVGYDDAMTDGRGHVGAFKIQNSWGTTWGQAGRAWIAYDALSSAGVLDVGFGLDRPGYAPTITAALSITHPRRGLLQVEIGVGDPAAPLWSDRVYSVSNAQAQANIAATIDLSDASAYWPPSAARPWWVRVTDTAGDRAVGKVAAYTITNAPLKKSLTPAVTMPQAIPDQGSVVVPVTGQAPVVPPKGRG